tara:strand:- start:209 stop:445 length:237 start_codon:yes stop_codon:yes gene_type:complete
MVEFFSNKTLIGAPTTVADRLHEVKGAGSDFLQWNILNDEKVRRRPACPANRIGCQITRSTSGGRFQEGLLHKEAAPG